MSEDIRTKVEAVFHYYRKYKFFDVSNKAAAEFIEFVEHAVEQLPDIEKELIELRYMVRNYSYISDFSVYKTKLYVSAPYYNELRKKAFENLYLLLNLNGDPYD